MPPGQRDLVQPIAEHPDFLERAFRLGSAIVFPWHRALAEISAAVRIVDRYLSMLPIEASFHGTDGLEADRQSLWVASTGLGRQFHVELADIANFDGDPRGGARGIEMLNSNPEVAAALSVLKCEIDRSLQATISGLHIDEDLPKSCLDAITVRYRAIRYAPVRREIAGIGMHPDGNLISALVTNQSGLIVLGGPGRIARPVPEAGVVIMPGSILTRWTDGEMLPTVHAVEIRRGDPTKCTVVGFLNFADGSYVPRNLRLAGRNNAFCNEVQEFKRDDMRPNGYLKSFYRDRGFVVGDGNRAKFRTLAELTS